jgi:hypothetical protein
VIDATDEPGPPAPIAAPARAVALIDAPRISMDVTRELPDAAPIAAAAPDVGAVTV